MLTLSKTASAAKSRVCNGSGAILPDQKSLAVRVRICWFVHEFAKCSNVCEVLGRMLSVRRFQVSCYAAQQGPGYDTGT